MSSGQEAVWTPGLEKWQSTIPREIMLFTKKEKAQVVRRVIVGWKKGHAFVISQRETTCMSLQ